MCLGLLVSTGAAIGMSSWLESFRLEAKTVISSTFSLTLSPEQPVSEEQD